MISNITIDERLLAKQRLHQMLTAHINEFNRYPRMWWNIFTTQPDLAVKARAFQDAKNELLEKQGELGLQSRTDRQKAKRRRMFVR